MEKANVKASFAQAQSILAQYEQALQGAVVQMQVLRDGRFNTFDLEGRLANGRTRWRAEGAYRGDARAYPIELPDLPRPEIKVEDGKVYVWTAQA